jgi:GWxTD domain-containing protein
VTHRIFPAATAVAILAGLSGCGGGRQTISASRIPAAIDYTAEPLASESYEEGDLDHLRIFLSESEIQAYPSLSRDLRHEMFRTIWASLDPTPTTDRNERKEEHYRRLAYARKAFLRKASPAWDRRGDLLIRYGSPFTRNIISANIEEGSVIPPREIWTYLWPKMEFHVADLLATGDFQDDFRWMPSNRPGMGHGGPVDVGVTISRELDEPWAVAQAEKFHQERLLGQGFHALREEAQAYLHDFGGRNLDYVFDVMNFAAPSAAKTMVEIGLLFRAADLAFTGKTAELDVEVVAKTMDYREVSRASHTVRQSRPSSSFHGLMADEISLELPPGDYRLALQVRDAKSGNIGIFTTQSKVREFSADRLQLSDVQLASTVEGGKGGQRFSKGDVLVVPHPGGVFPQGSAVGLYFEVYGLTVPREGEASFTITFTVTSKEAKTDDRPSISISNEGASRDRNIQKYLSFNTSNMEPGLYEVEVSVEDHVAHLSTKQSALLRVDPGPEPPKS